jgi:HD-like signal output (HDOD) protein
MTTQVGDVFERIEQICPVPATAQRVMALCASADAEIPQIAEAVASDPALAVEVMRIANSAAYGRARQVGDLGQAILMMGLRELGQMATAMAMLAAFHTKRELSHDLHETAVLAGSIARGLAAEVEVDPGKAFVCGLLGEVGAMACLAVDGEAFASLLDEAGADLAAREDLEIRRYGRTTRVVGALLLRHNGLPEEIAETVEARPSPSLPRGLGRVAAFARETAPIVVRMGASAGTPAGRAALERELSYWELQTAISIPTPKLLDVVVEASARTLHALEKTR